MKKATSGQKQLTRTKSYLTLWFNSEGSKTSDVTQRLMSMGFNPTHGAFDYEYDWTRGATTDDCVGLADQVHATLKDCNVNFKLHTQR